MGLHFMDDVFQSGSTNPGMMNRYRINVGLPSYYLSFYHSGPTIDDMLRENADGSFTIDVDAGLEHVEANNYLELSGGLETFNVGIRLNRLQFGISHAIRFGAFFKYKEELPQMAFNGNAQYIGETVDVGPGFDVSVLNEIALSGAFQVSEKLSVGARLKYISGVGNISTSKDQISIYTDPEYYQLTGTTDYQVNTGSDFFQLNVDTNDVSITTSNISAGDFFGGSTGFGVDLGAVYRVNDKITVAASVVDLGTINWNKNVTNFTSQGQYTFEGIDASETFFGEDSLDFEGVIDTIYDIFEFEEGSESYSTPLRTKFYISGTYNITETLEVGGLFFGQMVDGSLRPAIAVSARKRFGNIFSVGGVYAIRNNSFDNLGLNFGVKLGPVQLFGASDNIISVFKPYDTRNVNMRLGLNIAIAKKRTKSVDD